MAIDFNKSIEDYNAKLLASLRNRPAATGGVSLGARNIPGTEEFTDINILEGAQNTVREGDVFPTEVLKPASIQRGEFTGETADALGAEIPLDINTQIFFQRLIPFSAQAVAGTVQNAEQIATGALTNPLQTATNIAGGVVNAQQTFNNLTNEELLRMALLSPANMDARGISPKIRGRENAVTEPEVFDGKVDLEMNLPGSQRGRKKRLLEKIKGDTNLLGGLLIRPIDSEISKTKTVFLPFQFNPDIKEGSYTAQYESIQILGRVGNIHSYLRTDIPEITINLKYMVTAKNTEDRFSNNDYGRGWMKMYTPAYLKKIESMFRAIALPQFANGTDNGVYLAPPFVNIIFGNFKKDKYNTKREKNQDGTFLNPIDTAMGDSFANLALYRPGKGGSGFSLKKFICTSVNINKDYVNNPLIHQRNELSRAGAEDDQIDTSFGNLDSIMFEVSLSLQEVTQNYENYYYDFYDYYSMYTSDYLNAKDNAKQLDPLGTTAGDYADYLVNEQGINKNTARTIASIGANPNAVQANDDITRNTKDIQAEYETWRDRAEAENDRRTRFNQNAVDNLREQLYGETQAYIFKNEGLGETNNK